MNTLEALNRQHAENLKALEDNVKQLAACRRMQKRNRRYLKWLGWSPLAFMVRDASAELDAATLHLEEVDAELKVVDTQLLEMIARIKEQKSS